MSTITFVLNTVGSFNLVELWCKMSVHNYFCPRYCRFVLFGRAICAKCVSTITFVLNTVGLFYLVELYGAKWVSIITFVLNTVGAFYLVELWYKLSVHNYVCPCILFGRVMVQMECPQLPLS